MMATRRGRRRKDDAWFAPKRYGYGAGLPLCWQGWAMIAAHIALILIALPVIRFKITVFVLYATVMTLLSLPFYAAKTRGGWRWRWGDRDRDRD